MTVEVNQEPKNDQEDLNKALDAFIDDFFAEEAEEVATEEVEKSMIKDQKPERETADQAMKEVPGSSSDDKNPGRPKQISDVPKNDEDGKRSGEYDGDISEKNEDGKNKEQDQVKPGPEMVKKAWEETEEYKEYVELKKAKQAKEKEEELRKAKEEQSDLIKSALKEAIIPFTKENEELKKQLQEQGELIKSMANKPQKSKAVTNITAVEKFAKSEDARSFSKTDLLDAAEELVKSGELEVNHVIELEQTGYIYEKGPREILERKLKRQSR